MRVAGRRTIPKMKKINPKPVGEATEPPGPADLQQALAAAPLAEAAWRELTPIARRDFAAWIDSAKQPETRRRRIERACESIAAGKRRPCCYAVVPMDFYKAIGAAPMAKAQWGELTPTERRDLIDWIESTEARETRKGRIKEACARLAAGDLGTRPR